MIRLQTRTTKTNGTAGILYKYRRKTEVFFVFGGKNEKTRPSLPFFRFFFYSLRALRGTAVWIREKRAPLARDIAAAAANSLHY